MRTKMLIENLQNIEKPLSRTSLAKRMNLSESSIRNLVRETNQIGSKNGFRVELKKGEGYYLSLLDQKQFDLYMKNQVEVVDVYNPKLRIKNMLFDIFQKEGYFTFEQLAESIQVSRSTIVRDFEKVEEVLKEYGLSVERKPHFGLRITGQEQNYRRAFSEFVLASDLYLEPAQEFQSFLKSFNHDDLKSLLREELIEKELKMSDVALNNVLNHIQVLIFRAKKHNFVLDKIRVESPEKVYYQVAKNISIWIEKHHDVSLPEAEVSLLSAHIAGKTSAGNLGEREKKELLGNIDHLLIQIDSEFFTQLAQDHELKEALILHIFPLISRMYNNLHLENPIIDEVYRKYSNVFLIAFRFSELIEESYGFDLTIDEIGYLTLHFAAHFERLKFKALESYKRIVVICATGGGSAHLLKLKLESIFPKAIIVTSSANETQKFVNELPDLFLTTIPIKEDFNGVPIIHIKQWLDDAEINRIKDTISLNYGSKTTSNSVPNILELFSEKFYYRNDIRDYGELLIKKSKDLIENGYAVEGFDVSVIEREKKFTTIYKNGIAGPHAMKLEGIKDAISVTVYDTPFEWEGRTVQIVFLINLQQGHLFLHKEISRLLLSLMEDEAARERIVNARDFGQLKIELVKLIKG